MSVYDIPVYHRVSRKTKEFVTDLAHISILRKAFLSGLQRPNNYMIDYPLRHTFHPPLRPRGTGVKKPFSSATRGAEEFVKKPENLKTFDPSINLFTVANSGDLFTCRSLMKERNEHERNRNKGVPAASKLPARVCLRYGAACNVRRFDYCLQQSKRLPKSCRPQSQNNILPNLPSKFNFQRYEYIEEKRRKCLENYSRQLKQPLFSAMAEIVAKEEEEMINSLRECQEKADRHALNIKTLCLKTSEALELAETETRLREEVVNQVKHTGFLISHFNVDNAKLQDHVTSMFEEKDFIFRVILYSDFFSQDEAGEDEEEKLQAKMARAEEIFVTIVSQNPEWLEEQLEQLELQCLASLCRVQDQEAENDKLLQKIREVREKTEYTNNINASELSARRDNVLTRRYLNECQKDLAGLQKYLNLSRYVDMVDISPNDPILSKMELIGQLMEYYHENVTVIYKEYISHSVNFAKLELMEMLKGLENLLDGLHEQRLNCPRNLYSQTRHAVRMKRIRDERIRLAQAREAARAELFNKVRDSRDKPIWKQEGRRIMERSFQSIVDKQSREHHTEESGGSDTFPLPQLNTPVGS